MEINDDATVTVVSSAHTMVSGLRISDVMIYLIK
jgi:hypothetical protein